MESIRLSKVETLFSSQVRKKIVLLSMLISMLFRITVFTVHGLTPSFAFLNSYQYLRLAVR